MDKRKETSWNDAENLVTEVIRENQKQAKRWFIAFLLSLAALVGTNAYWIYVFNSYEYVTQDGEGINTINTGNQEGVNIGTENED